MYDYEVSFNDEKVFNGWRWDLFGLFNWITTIFTILGFIGVIIIYFKYKALQITPYKVIIWMCFFDVLMNLGNFLSQDQIKHPGFCKF